MPDEPAEQDRPSDRARLDYERLNVGFHRPLPPALPGAVVVGFAFCLGVGTVWVGGAIWYVNTIWIGGSPPPVPRRHWGPVLVFWMIVAAASWGVVQLIRAPGRKRIFVAGFLIGVAAASLLEGICFVKPG